MSEHAEDIVDVDTQRQDQRIAVYAAATLCLADGTRHACELLNVSAGGAMIKWESEADPSETAGLELPAVGEVPARVAWQHNQFLGLAFGERIENIQEIVQAITVANEAADEQRQFKRTSVLWRGRLYCSGKTHEVRVLNISPGGAKLRGPALDADAAIMLIVERAGEVPARVVWSEDGQIGVRFLDRPSDICRIFGDLLPAMRAHQRGDADR